jgi:hypothetical protein
MQLLSNARRAAFAAATIAIAACAAKSAPRSENEEKNTKSTEGQYRDTTKTSGGETSPSRGARGDGAEKTGGKFDEKPNLHDHEAGRKVIRNGRVDIVVPAYEDARAKLDALVAQVGGYIDSTQVTRGQGASSSAVVVLRVPAA